MAKVGALPFVLVAMLSSLVRAQDGTGLDERPDSDPSFAPIENQFLLFPMIEKDFWNWGSRGSAVFLNNKAVIAPEASNRRGLIHTTQPNPKKDHWYAVVDFNIGREKVRELNRSGEGLGIYYLRNFDSGAPDINQNFFGFMDDFDGVGVFINTLQNASKKNRGAEQAKLVSVSSFANDGKKMAKQNSPDKNCYRELTGRHLHFSKIAIEYEKPMLTVSTYDHESQQFVNCFSQDINLDYEGFFVISASSGTVFPQYNFVNSFKLFDPTVVQMSHHFEDSHARRAEHDHYATGMAETIADLIHVGAVESGESFEDMNTDELMETLAVQMFYIQPLFEDTHGLLSQVAHHFQTIAGVVSQEQLYDHSIHMNENLFQTYFSMSTAIAKELNYLETKDEELEKILEKQIAEGDVAARNRRRKNSKPEPQAMEVNNRETKKLIDSLGSLKSKVTTLNKLSEDLISLNKQIEAKAQTVERIQSEQKSSARAKQSQNRDVKQKYIKDRVDLNEVDDIFDDIIDEKLNNGVIFSTINLSMMAVIAISGYLYFKLSKADAF